MDEPFIEEKITKQTEEFNEKFNLLNNWLETQHSFIQTKLNERPKNSLDLEQNVLTVSI